MANVLVVEDDRPIARIIAASIALSGHAVRIAYGVSEAMDSIIEGWPDVVTLDLRLRDEDGSAVLIRARRRGSRARFVIVSAYDAETNASRLGADAWIEKPFDPLYVSQRVQELAETSRRETH